MADSIDPLVAFSGGEEIVASDFEDTQYLLQRRLISQLATWQIGAAYGLASGVGPDGFVGQGNHAELPTDEASGHVWVPVAGQMFRQADLLTKSLYNYGGRLAMAGVVGPADGFLPIRYAENIAAFSGATFPAGIPAANPRWDSLEIELEEIYEDTDSRDTEDAATRALTTGTPNKRIGVDFAAVGWVSGAEAALPDFPALTAGRARILSVKRIVGEGGTILRDAYACHLYPVRLGFEDVMAEDCQYDPSAWSPTGMGILERLTTSASDGLNFISRNMHAGCRLLAIGVSWSVANEPEIILGRATFDGSSGLATTSIVDCSGNDGGPSVGNGLTYIGEAEWSLAGLLESGAETPYPIWGNGHSYGPLFTNELATDAASKLYVALSEQLDTWDTGDQINFVRFIYAY